jgi:hypothetical protein
MGRLTIENDICQQYPDVVVMVLGHLERENSAHVRGVWLSLEDDTTNYLVEGDGIPEGDQCFRVQISQIVPGVVRLGIIK